MLLFIHHYFIFLGFAFAFFISFFLCPLFRTLAIHFNIIDYPNAYLKNHTSATPYLGGISIALAFIFSFIVMYQYSTYPLIYNHTTHAILFGGFLIVIVGLIDDVIKKGLSFKIKFALQFVASIALVLFGQEIHSGYTDWLYYLLQIIWVIGIMNAINIIDIMDGLAGVTIIIISLGFLFILLPAESIYARLSSSIFAGSVLGFLPYNFSKKRKIFMGDTGSLLSGYILSVFSLHFTYSNQHANFLSPTLILGVPIFDTIFVMFIRYYKGISPFRGSRDHFAFRLEKMGFTPLKIIFLTVFASFLCCCCAGLTIYAGFYESLAISIFIFSISCITGVWLAKVNI